MSRDLPISYLCNGPRVPEDIQDASVEATLSALFTTDA
jgi:flagellar biosynthesis GTPase FlhF